jgi:hypothetical protein
MSTRFPGTGVDDNTTLPNPNATDKTNNPSHSSLHGNANDAIKAIETKLGTGSSTPANNTLLIGDGAGTSAWSQLSSAQLAARITDETGSGSAVFATSPTLVTPLVNTINEASAGNGVTIDSLNIKDGKLNTNDSVVTANITNGSVTPSKLSSASSAGYIATSQTTTSTSYTDLATAGPSVTVSVGANGLVLLSWSARILNSGSNYTAIGFVASGANTIAATDTNTFATGTGTDMTSGRTTLLTGLNAGSTTFTLKYRVAGGTGTYIDRRLSAIPL